MDKQNPRNKHVKAMPSMKLGGLLGKNLKMHANKNCITNVNAI